MTLYLASTNPGKLRELTQTAVEGCSVELLPNFCTFMPCHEDGKTFEENARKKACTYSELADGLVLGEDSGLSVEALNGAPGIFSARFAGPESDDDANNRKLLWELRGEPSPRAAHYTCAMAVAERGQVLAMVEGRAEGLILDSPRGSGGFGYDPLFFYPPLVKTFAELTPAEKFRVSHRGQAFRNLIAKLGRLA